MMRYIKSYNESNSAGLTEQDIQDFCEMNLAYLMDDGLKVSVNEDDYSSIFNIFLSFNSIEKRNWVDVKDQVIPFLIRLRKQYELSYFEKDYSSSLDNQYHDLEVNVLFLSGGEVGVYTYYTNVDDLVKERIGATIKSDNKIRTIEFIIKGRKGV